MKQRRRARIKTTTDADWIAENRTDQVDIASKQFKGPPRDWRKKTKMPATAGDEDCRASAQLPDPELHSRKDIDGCPLRFTQMVVPR